MRPGTFSENKTPYRWKSYVLILMALWTVIIATSLVWNLFEMKNRVLETARTQADIAYTKNIIYRRWNTEHGGVYVEVREDVQPNPFLEDIPERDIVTPSGKVLTLINPAFMMRQVYAITRKAHGINERLVSLVPLNPDNMADPWEAEALRGFESGAPGVSTVTEIEGVESMRFIRPLTTEKSCLRCHATQGYREGDVQGALSIMLPMAPIWAAAKRSASTLVTAHILLWLLGSGGILLMAIRLRRTEMDRMRMVGDLKTSRAGLEIKVEERTAELAETNEALRQDITKRESAEEALKAEREHLYSILDIIPGLVYLQARDHSIRFANRRFIEEYGEPWERPCYEVMWERSEPCEECPTFRVFETKKPEVSVSEHPSRGRTYQVYDEPFVDSDGTLLVLEISIDITDRKKLEAQALKTQKLDSLGILAGGIAHDFNNLLTGIVANLSLAELTVDKSAGIYKRLVEVGKAASQARDLTQQLLTFSKGGQPLKETIAIGALIQESVCFATRGSGLRCEFSLADDLWCVDADEGQLTQVISNLVINACQAMPEGGVITARAENRTVTGRDKLPLKDGRYVMVSIEDQGIGIPKELLPKIFDPYFTTKEKGSGLGLASAYSVVKKHGGCIDAVSTPGLGTTFRFYLPASGEAAAVKKEVFKKIPASAGGRVLVMDDEVIIRNVTYEILTTLGYEAVTAEEGNEAVRLYKEAGDKGEPFDVVIMDLTVQGGMGGRETVKRLLEIDPGARVIVSSGYSNDPIMADYKDYGFSDVIPKPYTVEELSEKLYHVIKEGH